MQGPVAERVAGEGERAEAPEHRALRDRAEREYRSGAGEGGELVGEPRATGGLFAGCRAVLGCVGSFQGRINSFAPYRLLLADPPYSSFPGQRLLDWCSEPGLLEPEGVLVVERDSRVEPAEGEGSRFRLERAARYGRVTIDVYSARF